jgi:hypothetical protein
MFKCVLSSWVLVVGLSACPAPESSSPPVILEADAWCDDDGEWWTFWANVTHEDGPRAVRWVRMEGLLELGDGLIDSLYVADLEYQAEGEWSGSLENGLTGLDCDAPAPYVYLFTAEDLDGEQGYFDIYESLE